jgi:hypothetical protein
MIGTAPFSPAAARPVREIMHETAREKRRFAEAAAAVTRKRHRRSFRRPITRSLRLRVRSAEHEREQDDCARDE